MYPKSPDIASLISSRICHDLASPLGAITNGLELMELYGVASSPEFALLSDSVENASARINFFRFAFGPTGTGVLIGENEIRSTIDRYYGESRITVIWAVAGDIPRSRVKLALLTLSCLESFLPFGGTMTVSGNQNNWTIVAGDPRLRVDPDQIALLQGRGTTPEIKPSQVQFELLRQHLATSDVALGLEEAAETLTLNLQFSGS